MSALFEAGLNVTAIGMSVVFVLLGLLVGVIRGMSALCRLIEGPPATQPSAAPAGGAAAQRTELIGAIGAAVAVHRKRHRGRDRSGSRDGSR